MDGLPIYLDYNSTTPCDPRVVEAMLPFFTQEFGNAASSDHRYGWLAKDRVEEAREQVAQLIGASVHRMVFTSGATEAINLALKGVAEGLVAKGNHIITCRTEHRAVLDTCAYLENKGYRVTYLDVDNRGHLSLEELEAAIDGRTICIALMYANNETGVVQPIREIGALAGKHRVLFFCDGTSAVGKISVDVQADGIDLLACSSHKIYGPKGVGTLYVGRNAAMLKPQQHGGGQEAGIRSGTLNTPGIVGFGKAAALCKSEMGADGSRLGGLRDKMEHTLLRNLPGLVINGEGRRMPHVTSLLLPAGDAEQLLLSLSPYLAASRGSACSGLTQHPSHVLKAMGMTDDQAHRVIRISLGRFTSEEDVELVLEYLTTILLTTTVELSVGKRDGVGVSLEKGLNERDQKNSKGL